MTLPSELHTFLRAHRTFRIQWNPPQKDHPVLQDLIPTDEIDYNITLLVDSLWDRAENDFVSGNTQFLIRVVDLEDRGYSLYEYVTVDYTVTDTEYIAATKQWSWERVEHWGYHLKPKPNFDFFLYFHPRVHHLKIPNPLPEHPHVDYDYSEGLDNQIEFEFFDPIQPKYLLSRRHYPTAGVHILAIAHVRKRVNLEREWTDLPLLNGDRRPRLVEQPAPPSPFPQSPYYYQDRRTPILSRQIEREFFSNRYRYCIGATIYPSENTGVFEIAEVQKVINRKHHLLEVEIFAIEYRLSYRPAPGSKTSDPRNRTLQRNIAP
ncbi:hypothetical protein DL96DRAFT_1557098 [Flagelloscypha sp. PMI_526]|nr:hypothetical protein DL96DRAFT_1557098 [Flagelloscypha sp. PMI_526]